jgi:hypothetical protein
LFACPIAASQDDDASYAGNLFAAALEENMPLWLVKYNVPGAVVSYIDGGEVEPGRRLSESQTGAPVLLCTLTALSVLPAAPNQ